MLSFLGILTPSRSVKFHPDEQRPFFGPDPRPGRLEQQSAILAGQLPPLAYQDLPEDDERRRFVHLLQPPFI